MVKSYFPAPPRPQDRGNKDHPYYIHVKNYNEYVKKNALKDNIKALLVILFMFWGWMLLLTEVISVNMFGVPLSGIDYTKLSAITIFAVSIWPFCAYIILRLKE